MRSKEVEEAIHRLTFDKKFVLNGGNNIITSADTIDTALSYIEQLEQLPNKIRDKIKLYELEIETLKTLYPKSYTKDDKYKLYVIKIQELKSIIGE